VAPASEGGVDVKPVLLHGECGKHFVDKHRFVLIQPPNPL